MLAESLVQASVVLEPFVDQEVIVVNLHNQSQRQSQDVQQAYQCLHLDLYQAWV
jgi:hypothetical protein